jgi:hypothetical protein
VRGPGRSWRKLTRASLAHPIGQATNAWVMAARFALQPQTARPPRRLRTSSSRSGASRDEHPGPRPGTQPGDDRPRRAHPPDRIEADMGATTGCSQSFGGTTPRGTQTPARLDPCTRGLKSAPSAVPRRPPQNPPQSLSPSPRNNFCTRHGIKSGCNRGVRLSPSPGHLSAPRPGCGEGPAPSTPL